MWTRGLEPGSENDSGGSESGVHRISKRTAVVWSEHLPGWTALTRDGEGCGQLLGFILGEEGQQIWTC